MCILLEKRNATERRTLTELEAVANARRALKAAAKRLGGVGGEGAMFASGNLWLLTGWVGFVPRWNGICVCLILMAAGTAKRLRRSLALPGWLPRTYFVAVERQRVTSVFVFSSKVFYEK